MFIICNVNEIKFYKIEFFNLIFNADHTKYLISGKNEK